MNVKTIKNLVISLTAFGKANAPAILAGAAAVGMVITAVSAYKAGVKSKKILDEHEADMRLVEKGDKKAESAVYKATARKLAPIVVGPVLIGAVSVGCVFGSLSASAKRIAALSAALSLSESSLKDMESKMTEMLGAGKSQDVKEAIMKDKLRKDPPSNTVLVGDGEILCKDLYTGRTFSSKMEKIQRSIAYASTETRDCMWCSLNEFYDSLGLESVAMGDQLGWDIDSLERGTVPVDCSAILLDDGRPCVAMDLRAVTERCNRW